MGILFLVRQPDGSLTGPVGASEQRAWELTNYPESPCDADICPCMCHRDTDTLCDCNAPFICSECDEPIYGQHYVCMDDGSDHVHVICAYVP